MSTLFETTQNSVKFLSITQVQPEWHDKHKKVLLRKRKRYTDCSLSSIPSADLSWGGGTPSLAGGYPIPGWGYPICGWGYPIPGWEYCHPWPGGTPSLDGVPHPWMGEEYPLAGVHHHLDLGRVPPIWTWLGYPCLNLDGVSPSGPGWGIYPPSEPGQGTCHLELVGVTPHLDLIGVPPPPRWWTKSKHNLPSS